MYTEEQLVSAYRKGFSNGIGVSEPTDRRYMLDAGELAEDALNTLIPGGLTVDTGY
jgi:hypothetical protein